MKTISGKTISLLIVLILCMTLIGGCGATKDDSAAPKEDIEFLLGSWFADTASADGATVDAYDVFGGYFMLYFNENGECTMSIDQNRAIVKWQLTENGVTLTGDGTYEATFIDETRKSMVIVINGIDVLMEKYED